MVSVSDGSCSAGVRCSVGDCRFGAIYRRFCARFRRVWRRRFFGGRPDAVARLFSGADGCRFGRRWRRGGDIVQHGWHSTGRLRCRFCSIVQRRTVHPASTSSRVVSTPPTNSRATRTSSLLERSLRVNSVRGRNAVCKHIGRQHTSLNAYQTIRRKKNLRSVNLQTGQFVNQSICRKGKPCCNLHRIA